MDDFINKYEEAIPECCNYQTMQEHEAIMLCWGLASSVRAGKMMDCSGCPENKSFPVRKLEIPL